jgi:phage replication-related protein YjqB (UPF0714/DUF867 family)
VNTQFEGIIKKAQDTQATLLRQPEHCSLDPRRLANIGLSVGLQLRVRRDADDVALYTISETHDESADTTVRMAVVARRRLDTEDEFPATIDTSILRSELSDCEAREQSEFVERLIDDGCQRGLVCLAPHGGSIEEGTDDQAERVRGQLGSRRTSVWLCRGFKRDGGALKAWHITASAIHEQSFPLLNKIIGRGFTFAVAFHGFTDPDVLVGGGAPDQLKKDIADELTKALAGTGIRVRIATDSDKFDGDNPCNIVNRITAGGVGGIQIEQSLETRENHGDKIADAVVAVFRRSGRL